MTPRESPSAYTASSPATHAVIVYDSQAQDVLGAQLAPADLAAFVARRSAVLASAHTKGAYDADAFAVACARMDAWLAKLPAIAACGGGSACSRADAETAFITTLKDAPKEEVLAALTDSVVFIESERG